MSIWSKIAFILICGVGASALASPSEISNVPSLGEHHEILTIEKNENPQNVVRMYTKLDPQCQFIRESDEDLPLVDFYWLNDRRRYHPMHPLLKYGIRRRLQVEFDSAAENSSQAFAVRIKNLKELNHDLEDPVMQVTAKQSEEGCVVETHMAIGAASEPELVRLRTISAIAKKSFVPPFRKLVSVTLHGEKNEGEKVAQTFSARR